MTPDRSAAEAPRRIAVIVNPATRRNPDAVIAAIRAETPDGVDLDIRVTSVPGEARELTEAVRDTVSLVVAVGGDGTVADVATGLRGSNLPLAIVPAGSTNIIARELGIPTDPRAAARLLFGPHRLARLDLARCGDRGFLHMAGAGLDSRFFASTNRALKRRIGWLAYLPPAALALRHPPSRFTIVADGREISALSHLVLVANGGSIIAPGLRLHPQIRTDDGWLDLLVFTATAPLPIARTLGHLATRSLAHSPLLLTQRARRIELHAHPPLPIQLDGDVATTTPAEFTLEPGALTIVAPL